MNPPGGKQRKEKQNEHTDTHTHKQTNARALKTRRISQNRNKLSSENAVSRRRLQSPTPLENDSQKQPAACSDTKTVLINKGNKPCC